MQKIELELEKRCRAYARSRGWVCWKNENNGNKGIPDDSFLSPSGRFLMVEFKASATAKVRPEQIIWQAKFPNIVHLVSSFEDFVKIINENMPNIPDI